jgi:hypothetical protein
MRRLWILAAIAALSLLACASPAAADFGLKNLKVTFEEEDGTPLTRAGAHPFAMTTSIAVNTKLVPDGAEDPETGEPTDGEVPDGELRNLTIDQAVGLVGSQKIPRCSMVEFSTRDKSYPACSDETAVGYAAVRAEFGVIPVGTEDVAWHVPVYNLEPADGAAATFGFIPGNVPITFDVVVDEEHPHNLEVRLRDTPQALLFYGSEVTLWGVPADPVHDTLRGKCVGEPATATEDPVSKGSCPSTAPEVPLLTLPRSCKGPLSTLFAATSWQGAFDEETVTTAGMEGCAALPFEAGTSAEPTTAAGASPSGLDFGIEVEDEGLTDPEKDAQADIVGVQVTLPPGMVANPSAAEGQGTCTEAQFAAASLDNLGCPGDSKLGTVEVSSPLLDVPLKGSLYLATPRENPFGSLLATYLVLREERYGIFIKQAGEIRPDPETGQLTSTFDDLPELPFSDLRVHFREGPRAPLATPSNCGTYTSQALLTPSSGNPSLLSTSSFQITAGPGGGPCIYGIPFAPGFSAGSLNNTAGAFAPFYMRFTRSDGEGEITRLDATLPPGVVGKIAGLGRCSDQQVAGARGKSGKAELAQASCPADSEIGRVVAAAGVGPVLTEVSGKLYLAGPYGGHPLSVVSVVPAVAGPFDLGTVVVRSALDLNPDTAEVEVIGGASDPIPRILEGIPLAVRDLELYIDRPNFTLNATSCDEERAKATLFAGSISAALTQRYQAQGCGNLGFRPKLTLKLKGGTKRGQFPAVRSMLTPRAGDANIDRAVVFLPPSEQIENAHINNPCTRVQFAAEACPKKSILGRAKAWTPLLDQPLEGNVYFRSNGGERELPDLVADLRGQFRIVLVGFIDTKGKRIRTTFANVPDAPVSRFALNLFGGKRGLLVNNRNLCKGKKKLRTKLRLTGQNGKIRFTEPVLKTSCKKGKGGKKKGRGGRR